MSNVRLPQATYQKVAKAALSNVGVAYVKGHDFTVDGYMSAHDAVIETMSHNGLPGPIIDIAADILIRYADDARMSAEMAHSNLKHNNLCPVCKLGV